MQTLHRHLMRHRRKGVEGGRAHLLRGGIGRDKLRMLRLHCFQSAIKPVIFKIVDLRRILHIIFPVVIRDLIAERLIFAQQILL